MGRQYSWVSCMTKVRGRGTKLCRGFAGGGVTQVMGVIFQV